MASLLSSLVTFIIHRSDWTQNRCRTQTRDPFKTDGCGLVLETSGCSFLLVAFLLGHPCLYVFGQHVVLAVSGGVMRTGHTGTRVTLLPAREVRTLAFPFHR